VADEILPEPEFDSLEQLLLAMGCCVRSLDELFPLIVGTLGARPHVAGARIWLVGPGDACGTCAMAGACADRTACLHLVASSGAESAGAPRGAAPSGGPDRRIPLGVGEVGRVAALLERVELHDEALRRDSAADPAWLRDQGVRAFVGDPLIYQGERIGVLAVYLRMIPPPHGRPWLRMIADHAAAMIANARAFAEIQDLKRQLELDNAYLVEEVREARAGGDIVGASPALRGVLEKIDLVAPTDASVLILGESGTGKELVAREIHKKSQRADRRMVRVNCASIPRELYESEFFGHVKGAFTGAVKDREGRFEHADGGTIFLDEVGEIPLELQAKLLRVLQEGQYERVGEERTRQVDVRVIAATNRDLKAEVRAGRFREDLYYRLEVFPIEVVPLRHRREDVPALARRFLEVGAKRLNRPVPRLEPAQAQALQRHDWPGNVRELQNVVERALITARQGRVVFDLPAPAPDPEPGTPEPGRPAPPDAILTEAELRALERENARAALEQAGGRVHGPGGAAELLGLPPTTLASRLRKWGIRVRAARAPEPRSVRRATLSDPSP